MTDTLTGHIERVTFHNPESGFAVLKVKVQGRRDLATVIGNVMSVTAGEHLEAAGTWGTDREHGRQFKAHDLKTSHPASVTGIQRYLESGAIRSIGPKLAAKIVGIYQERALETIEKHPDMLLHIRGIGARRLSRIQKSWEEQKGVRRIMLFLHEHEIGSSRAVQIYRTYGDRAVDLIRANPYQIADDIRGVGFKTADALAAKLGVDPNSPHRAQAALRYTLQKLTEEGHCGYPQADVVKRTTQLVQIDLRVLEAAVNGAISENALVCDQVDGQSWLYLPALYRSEVGVASSIQKLLSSQTHPLPNIQVELAIGWVEDRLDICLAAAQKEAVRQVCQNQVVVVTGGPGVGKTTLVRSLLEIFEAKGLKSVLTAPTGRAAKRLAETTGRDAMTIHRRLEFDPASGSFKRNQRNPLAGDLFVLDETSMVDVVLGHQFLRAIPGAAAVVLVGDTDQLPSVGPGSVLADLIASRTIPVVRLTEIFRQSAQSQIVTAAYAINQGRLPELSAPTEDSDFYFIEAEDPDAIQDLVVRLVQERIPRRFNLDPKTDIQVLTPMNRSLLGTRNLNQVLQTTLNPALGQPEIGRFGSTFRVGDRVIQTQNNYSRDVFNGDLGVVENVNRIEQELGVSFDGRLVMYDFAEIDELALAYALSIHKSQGSEYPCVVIPTHTQHYMMLQRNLLYTAVTRGKQLVVLVGSRKALSLSVRRQDTSHRYSALQHRLLHRQSRPPLLE